MNLPEVCIRRPVMATMLSLVLVVAGLVAFFKLGYSYFPSITLPTVSIGTHYDGASSEFMADEVTKKEEDALTDIEGIDYMLSSSEDGSSSITVMLNDRSWRISKVSGRCPCMGLPELPCGSRWISKKWLRSGLRPKR